MDCNVFNILRIYLYISQNVNFLYQYQKDPFRFIWKGFFYYKKYVNKMNEYLILNSIFITFHI